MVPTWLYLAQVNVLAADRVEPARQVAAVARNIERKSMARLVKDDILVTWIAPAVHLVWSCLEWIVVGCQVPVVGALPKVAIGPMSSISGWNGSMDEHRPGGIESGTRSRDHQAPEL